MSEMSERNLWSHDETVVALGLYFQLTFSKTNMHHPEVVRVAKLIGRKPSAMAMKVVNLARLDPTLKAKGISGLKNGAKLEMEVWREFEGRLDALSDEYNRLLKGRTLGDGCDMDEMPIPPGLEKERIAKYRVNQSFFRHAVLSAYENTCCITGINDFRLLTASHIKPWAKCESGDEKTTPANGLCLNSLHDRAFDRGLVTVDSSFKLVLSSSLREALTHDVYEEYFAKYEGKRISLPRHHPPTKAFLEYHNCHVFAA